MPYVYNGFVVHILSWLAVDELMLELSERHRAVDTVFILACILSNAQGIIPD